MFGYVSVDEEELKVRDFKRYKAYYCGLCRTLQDKYGGVGQLTLSYDMTFVVILLTSLYDAPTRLSFQRCKAHPFKKQKALTNEMTGYAADMNLLLSYYHLRDDWQDERKAGSLLASAALKKKAKAVCSRYPRQCTRIREELKALSNLEKEGSVDIDRTAGCFGRIMSELLTYQEDIWAERLRGLGFYLGKFIYILDAYEDMEKDLKKGCFNPLKGYLGRKDYAKCCSDMLRMMIGEACIRFESLPCVLDIDILRNILYGGVWNRYRRLMGEKNKSEDKEDYDKKPI